MVMSVATTDSVVSRGATRRGAGGAMSMLGSVSLLKLGSARGVMIGGASLAGAAESFQSAMTESCLGVSEGSSEVDARLSPRSLASRSVGVPSSHLYRLAAPPQAANTSSAIFPSVASRSKNEPVLWFVNTASTIGPDGAYMIATSLPRMGGQSPVLCPIDTPRKRTRCGKRDV